LLSHQQLQLLDFHFSAIYGFAKLGTYIDMGILQLLMVVIFALVSMQEITFQKQCDIM